MNKSGKLSSVVALVLMPALAYWLFGFTQTKCQKTITFSIGSVDARFNLKKDEVKLVAQDAASKWNNQTGRQLLKYTDGKSNIKINLIYDSRQEAIDHTRNETQKLNQNQQNVDQSKAQIEEMVNKFETDLQDYNNDVTKWNEKGGAPPEIFTLLEQQRRSLESTRQKIDTYSKSLNLKINSFNSEVDKFNEELKQQENKVVTQGLYYPREDKIEIYTYGNNNELRLVLMHELGHALGLDHALNDTSIMYYLLSKQNIDNPKVTEEDKKMVDGRCRITNKNFYYSIFGNFFNSIH